MDKRNRRIQNITSVVIFFKGKNTHFASAPTKLNVGKKFNKDRPAPSLEPNAHLTHHKNIHDSHPN